LLIVFMHDPLTLTQVLCTRLCHDLAGPIGAVAAGVELVGGDPSQADAETLALIANSSAAASRKLKFLRLALGTPAASGQALADIRPALEGYLHAVAGTSGTAEVAWFDAATQADLAAVGPGRAAQALANLALVALETVPRARRLEVTAKPGAAGCDLSVAVHGHVSAQVDPRADLAALLRAPADAAITPKTVQPLYLHDIVSRGGGSLTVELLADGCRVAALLPNAR
jgi:histidine phosphotransferase ChpT